MKFLLFADLHYFPGVWYRGTWDYLKEMQACAEREGCDFIIHAGDFCHGPSQEHTADFVKAYNDFHIPSYHCLGNHDADRTSYEETVCLYNMPNGYYSLFIIPTEIILSTALSATGFRPSSLPGLKGSSRKRPTPVF